MMTRTQRPLALVVASCCDMATNVISGGTCQRRGFVSATTSARPCSPSPISWNMPAQRLCVCDYGPATLPSPPAIQWNMPAQRLCVCDACVCPALRPRWIVWNMPAQRLCVCDPRPAPRRVKRLHGGTCQRRGFVSATRRTHSADSVPGHRGTCQRRGFVSATGRPGGCPCAPAPVEHASAEALCLRPQLIEASTVSTTDVEHASAEALCLRLDACGHHADEIGKWNMPAQRLCVCDDEPVPPMVAGRPVEHASAEALCLRQVAPGGTRRLGAVVEHASAEALCLRPKGVGGLDQQRVRRGTCQRRGFVSATRSGPADTSTPPSGTCQRRGFVSATGTAGRHQPGDLVEHASAEALCLRPKPRHDCHE